MNVGFCGYRNIFEVDVEVVDLMEEVVLVCELVVILVIIGIGINDSYVCKVGSSF